MDNIGFNFPILMNLERKINSNWSVVGFVTLKLNVPSGVYISVRLFVVSEQDFDYSKFLEIDADSISNTLFNNDLAMNRYFSAIFE